MGAVADTRALLAFRARSVRRPLGAMIGVGIVLGLTIAAAVVPALLPDAGSEADRASDARLLLPTLLAGFLALATVTAIAGGGGRELLPRDQAAIHPVSPTTDHLGALLMAPLNVAWLIQAWVLIALTGYAVGGALAAPAQVVTLLWLVTATCLAQVVAWTTETVRRRPHGVATVRVTGVLLGALIGWLQMTDRLVPVLDRAPTIELVVAMVSGLSPRWALTVAILVVMALAAVLLGAWPAHRATRRTPRDEQRVESDQHPARPLPGRDATMLLRIDRASVWRAVPMRRGLTVLAVGPGLVALAGGLAWDSVVVLPGLVVSGGALLFGVNGWCLDGRGALWRESLPVAASTVFGVRAWVLAEWLAIAALVTVVLASLRAGVPTAAEAAAVITIWLVITLQVVAVAMSWSGRRPFAAHLRSARATPAPPVVMVGYSAKLATSTTLTALVFSGMSYLAWWASPLAAVPFVVWSVLRLRRARRTWLVPEERARVVATVAA